MGKEDSPDSESKIKIKTLFSNNLNDVHTHTHPKAPNFEVP